MCQALVANQTLIISRIQLCWVGLEARAVVCLFAPGKGIAVIDSASV